MQKNVMNDLIHYYSFKLPDFGNRFSSLLSNTNSIGEYGVKGQGSGRGFRNLD